MGFAIGYETTEVVSRDAAKSIIATAFDMVKGRTWLSCGPVLLHHDETGRLGGSSKPNFMPHPDDIASAQMEGLSDGTVKDVLDVLCALSTRFNIDWLISHDYGVVGFIRNGICDSDVQTQCYAFNDLAAELIEEGVEGPFCEPADLADQGDASPPEVSQCVCSGHTRIGTQSPQTHVAQEPSRSYLPLSKSEYYYIFPAYGSEFQDMMPWLKLWYSELGRDLRFWHGFSGGGILGVPKSLPISEHKRNNIVAPRSSLKYVYGCVLGNPAGRLLADSLCCAVPERPPPLAVKYGAAKRVPSPRVKATAEHANSIEHGRYLLIVPRENRKKLRMLEQVSDWFETFGVRTSDAPVPIPSGLRDEMTTWFGNPGRPILALELQEGEDNAAWQLAVTYYIAEFWDVNAPGLDSVHFVAAIEGEPNFRKNWTSNK